MSGKRKGKGRDKVADNLIRNNLPLKRYEVHFLAKNIDLRSFAYDFFVYSITKFGVPSNCIVKWEGKNNYYEGFHLCPILFRSMIKYQIEHRYKLYEMFNSRLEPNNLQISTAVEYVCQEAIEKLSVQENLAFLDKVEISLAVVSEMILFLYSKNANLYLRELSKMWAEWLRVNKDFFEVVGGFKCLYYKSCKEGNPQLDIDALTKRYGAYVVVMKMESNKPLETFYEEFITKQCSSYEDSAKDESLASRFFKMGDQYNLMKTPTFLMECHERQKKVGRNKSSRLVDSPRTSATVLKQEEDSLMGAFENPGLGIVPHEELLQIQGLGASASADVTTSPPPVGPHSREPHRHRKGSSVVRRIRTRTKSSLQSELEQASGQLSFKSSRTKQSREEKPSIQPADVATPSVMSLGAIPKQKAKVDTESIAEELGRLSLESFGTKQSSKDKPSFRVDVTVPRRRVPVEIPIKPAKEDSDSASE